MLVWRPFGGAAFLAAQGINPYKIQALGRWRSPLVIHYAGAALATGLAADLFRAGAAAQALNSSLRAPALPDPVSSPLVPGPPSFASFACGGFFVENNENRCVHWAAGAEEGGRTRCGWLICYRRANVTSSLPVDAEFHRVCGTCLPELRERLLQAEVQQVSTDDD